MAQIKCWFEKLSIISKDFELLSGFSLFLMSVKTLKQFAANLAIKYSEDKSDIETINEI